MKARIVKNQIAMELLVGGFMFLVLVGLFIFTIMLSQQNVFQKRYPLRVHFQDVMGLRDGDNVVVRGMTVGKIRRLDLAPDGVTVLALLEAPVDLRKDYQVTIITTSILGGRYMEIKTGSASEPPVPPDTVIQGEKPFDLMMEASAVVHDVRKALQEGGIVSNIQVSVAELRAVSEKLNAGQGTLGKLINDDSVYKDIQAITRDVKSAASQLQEVAGRIDRGEGTLGKLLKDDAVYEDVRRISANLRSISQRVEDGKGTLGKLLSEDDTLYTNLTQAVKSLNNVAGRIDRGEGLLGKLTTDETLYEEAKSVIHNLNAAVDDYRETTPVVSFVTILFGAF